MAKLPSIDPSERTRRTHLREVAALLGATGISSAPVAGGESDRAGPEASTGEGPSDAPEYGTELHFAPVTVLAKRIRKRKLSPVDLVEACLERIEERDDELNAFVTVTPDRAREAAREAERAVERGADLGPLHGVPFAVKDLEPVEGVRHTDGALPFEDRIAQETDPNVRKLVDAGAIVIGTVSTPEFGHMGKTDNLLVGPTSTPFDLDRNAGGSSGGSAAAVADGLVPFATGSDAGGSIRIPASFTGTYGLFPAPEDVGNFGSPSTFSQSGVQTRTVEDTAYLLSVMRDDETDYLEALERDVNGLSIGYSTTPGGWPVDERVRRVVEANVDAISGAGATVEETEIRFGVSYERVVEAMTILWSGATVTGIAGHLQDEHGIDVTGADSDLFTDYFVERVEEGRTFTESDGELREEELLTAIDARTRTFTGFQDSLAEYDLLVVPTVAVPPFSNDVLGPTRVAGTDVHPVYGWLITAVFNLIGLPAASVPAGTTDEGLPVGLQIVGSPFDTESVIAASLAYERENPWHDAYPGVREDRSANLDRRNDCR